MKADVKAEWISAGEKALLAAADGWSTDLTKLEVEDSARGQSLRWAFTSAILAAVIPLIQKEEREACEVAVSETAGTYPPLSKEQYALIEAMAAIRALPLPEPPK